MHGRGSRRVPALLQVLWSAVVAGALMGSAAPGSAAATEGWPPPTYRLDDVRMSVQRDPAHGLPTQRVEISGTGTVSLLSQGRQSTHPIDRDGVLHAINTLYRMRFFDLPARLLPPRSVFAKEDGTVATQATRLHDATTTTVCFAVADRRKCVVYDAGAPPELEAWVRDILSAAERHARQTGSPAK